MFKKLISNLFKKTDLKGNVIKIIGGLIAGGSATAIGLEPDTVEAVTEPNGLDGITALIKEIGVVIGLIIALIGQFRTKEEVKTE